MKGRVDPRRVLWMKFVFWFILVPGLTLKVSGAASQMVGLVQSLEETSSRLKVFSEEFKKCL